METIIKLSKEFILLVKILIFLYTGSHILTTIIFRNCCFVEGGIMNFNISLSDLVSCKEYRIDSGYVYRDFFSIDDIHNDNGIEGEILRLKFYVLTTKDAHILLAETDSPKKDDRVYEIVIGAGGNTFSTIRPQIGKGRLAIITKSEILSSIDPTPIEICQYKDGRFDVIIPGFMDPYMTFTNPFPLHIKYISFATFGSTPAKWFYDCQMDEGVDQITEEKRVMTPRQALISDLSESYNYDELPEGLKFVNFSFRVHGISYDGITSILRTRINLKLKWHDYRIQWDPINYTNINRISGAYFDFWTPQLVIANGARESNELFTPNFMKNCHSNGIIEMFASETLIDTWCAMTIDDKINAENDWPNDYLKCSIEIGLTSPNLTLLHDGSAPISDRFYIIELTEWHLKNVSVELSTKNNLFSKSETENEDDDEVFYSTMDATNTHVIIRLGLKRIFRFYHHVFVTPLIAASIILLISFYYSDSERGTLNLLALSIATVGLFMLARYVPKTKLPRIVISYTILMYTSCFAYILHMSIIWLTNYPPVRKPNEFVMNIINYSPLRLILGMRYTDSDHFLDAQRNPWREIATIVNRIIFIILSFIFLWIYINGH